MSFSNQIKKFSDETNDKMDKVTRMAFIEMSTRVIRRSPVGDADFWKPAKNGKIYKPKGYTGGRFRANWQASINRPAGGTKKSKNMSSSLGTVRAAARKSARSYYLMNNLPYAQVIENGHSKQAPNGIVRLVAAEWKQIVRMVSAMVK